MHTIAAILVASGFSRRFGKEDKLLSLFKGKPLARYTLELVTRMSRFNPVVFVAAKPEVAALAEDAEIARPGIDLRIVLNSHPDYGLRESVRLGVIAAGDADFYAFFPCDMPWLDAATVNAVLTRAAPGKIVHPVHNGQPGNPCVFAADFRDTLLSLEAGARPRDIQKRRPECVVAVEIADSMALDDIDRPEEMARCAN
ncbi:MAG: nucleotidyltransferase family protein [Spirochaetaceae bacterium]|jgi:molybdenum cofactor cytidylyltransferase|nr:nucleotidyltransferase family protein [Spirochaetaceae bacterium]